jgi:hypothetical protein
VSLNKQYLAFKQTACDADRFDGVLSWATPVPFFGDAKRATIATLGLNPSNLEFVDRHQSALLGEARRLPTLTSLGIKSWDQVSLQQYVMILDAFGNYFHNNPYSRWFDRLDALLSETGHSYYSRDNPVCHLDLVPYATSEKWSALHPAKRQLLIEYSSSYLGYILSVSRITTIIVNGRGVLNTLASTSDTKIKTVAKPKWSLPRKNSPVQGVAFIGAVSEIGGVNLGRKVRLLGYNHNLQSSFGVTNEVRHMIRKWVTTQLIEE